MPSDISLHVPDSWGSPLRLGTRWELVSGVEMPGRGEARGYDSALPPAPGVPWPKWTPQTLSAAAAAARENCLPAPSGVH